MSLKNMVAEEWRKEIYDSAVDINSQLNTSRVAMSALVTKPLPPTWEDVADDSEAEIRKHLVKEQYRVSLTATKSHVSRLESVHFGDSERLQRVRREVAAQGFWSSLLNVSRNAKLAGASAAASAKSKTDLESAREEWEEVCDQARKYAATLTSSDELFSTSIHREKSRVESAHRAAIEKRDADLATMLLEYNDLEVHYKNLAEMYQLLERVAVVRPHLLLPENLNEPGLPVISAEVLQVSKNRRPVYESGKAAGGGSGATATGSDSGHSAGNCEQPHSDMERPAGG